MVFAKRFSRSTTSVLLACLAVISSAEASAQVCPAPATLLVNTTQWFDTCQGDTSLVLGCGLFPLYGPALIVRMQLPYPVGQVSVQSLTPNYDSALFMLRSQCSNSAGCGQALDTGQLTDTLDLASVDSGDYFLAIAPFYPESTPCGQVLVTYSMTAAEQARAQDGLFRGGVSAGSPVH